MVWTFFKSWCRKS